MGNGLQDQLLNMGLVEKKKAAQVKKDNYKKNKKKQKNKKIEIDEAKILAQQAIEEKKQRDRELNLEKERIAQEKAIQAQIKQIIDLNKITKNNGDIQFNFQADNKVKTLRVSEEIHKHLGQGLLAVVSTEQGFEIVPKAIADKISQRDNSLVVLQNSRDEEEIDEYYSDYEIPDDLMW